MNFLEKISKSLFKDENYHSFCSVNSFFRLRNHPVKEKRRHPALGASLALETLGQCFSPRGDSTQPGTFDNVWRHFGLSQIGRCYWHLVNRGQGYCHTSCDMQDNLTTKNYPAQMSIVWRLKNPLSLMVWAI